MVFQEKNSAEGHNVGCLLAFPHFRDCGIGTFLISLSYELTKRKGQVGGPEMPLSDLGRRAYIRFWKWKISSALLQRITPGETHVCVSDLQ